MVAWQSCLQSSYFALDWALMYKVDLMDISNLNPTNFGWCRAHRSRPKATIVESTDMAANMDVKTPKSGSMAILFEIKLLCASYGSDM